ncbi:MAG: DUF6064 family protein [Ectothiorhodospiraceae bacterium]|jgi:hypothetical protein
MALPFGIDEFMGVFAAYNSAIGPMPLVLGLTALVAAIVACTRLRHGGRVVSALLAVLWAWTGIAYHIAFFTRINTAAYVFGSVFLAQALVFMWTGVVHGRLRFQVNAGARGIAGALLMTYGLVVYPLLGFAFGHIYPAMPTFGAPCPTTIFTIGLLFWAVDPWPRHVLLLPILWSAIGGTAAFQLGVPEDYGLLAAGAAALGLLIHRTVRGRSAAASEGVRR